jgi:hypothetical protein
MNKEVFANFVKAQNATKISKNTYKNPIVIPKPCIKSYNSLEMGYDLKEGEHTATLEELETITEEMRQNRLNKEKKSEFYIINKNTKPEEAEYYSFFFINKEDIYRYPVEEEIWTLIKEFKKRGFGYILC